MAKGDFGEPWTIEQFRGRPTIFDRHHTMVSEPVPLVDGDEDRTGARHVACVNAMSGVEDPKAFMEAVRRVIYETSPENEAKFWYAPAESINAIRSMLPTEEG